MAISVYVVAKTNPDQSEAFHEFLKELLPETRTKEGCQHVELTQNQDDPTHFVVFEKWDSREHHERYVRDLMKSGTRDRVYHMLASELAVYYCDVVEA